LNESTGPDGRGLDWNAIVAEHGPAVWATVLRILKHRADAQDCYQQVFLDALRAPRLHVTHNWAALLKTIATRRSIDCLRKRISDRTRRQRIAPFEEPGAEAAVNAAPSEDLELTDVLRAGLAALPAKQATAFWLRNVEELSYAEIAVQMALDANEVGVLLHRARASLQRHFARDPASGRKLR
jgi:RNA polymerase sigma factor (sigma-70 family)